jgi:hypothetical protein
VVVEVGLTLVPLNVFAPGVRTYPDMMESRGKFMAVLRSASRPEATAREFGRGPAAALSKHIRAPPNGLA